VLQVNEVKKDPQKYVPIVIKLLQSTHMHVGTVITVVKPSQLLTKL